MEIIKFTNEHLKYFNSFSVKHWINGLLNSDKCIVLGIIREEDIGALIIGEICAGDNGLIWSLYVNKDLRRQGIATRLMHEVEDFFIKNKVINIRAYCNDASDGLFSSLNYSNMSTSSYKERSKSLITDEIIKNF